MSAIHEDPKTEAVCPKCHPERVDAAYAAAQVEDIRRGKTKAAQRVMPMQVQTIYSPGALAVLPQTYIAYPPSPAFQAAELAAIARLHR
jgi:hypothetical protein